ncbi:MAG: LPS export ABC transporter periplasmic protein LptC [Alphaproteobacteria bacterium]|nr:LPS export ABC transporter periplasmic protein LptC [Alphaproteobacteria bacterium]
MKKDKRNFIIFSKHRRWQRLWQFFFTGWGLVMVAALVAGALFTRQLLWSPISAINMTDVISNQFKMSGASFQGIDSNGEPFKISAEIGRQEYDNPDVIFLERVTGQTTQIQNGAKVTYKFSANGAEYNRINKTVTLRGNVRIKSNNGDELQTKELVVRI